jgi:hypothetical protein
MSKRKPGEVQTDQGRLYRHLHSPKTRTIVATQVLGTTPGGTNEAWLTEIPDGVDSATKKLFMRDNVQVC